MSRLVTVHSGPPWEVELLQGRLTAEGIPSFLPERNTKILDPFITGGNALAVRLEVPADRAEAARAVVAEYREATREDEDEASEEGSPADEDASRRRAQARLGRRIRWATIFALVTLVTAPLAVVLGLVYLARLSPDGERPVGHGSTVVAILVSVAITVGGVWVLATL